MSSDELERSLRPLQHTLRAQLIELRQDVDGYADVHVHLPDGIVSAHSALFSAFEVLSDTVIPVSRSSEQSGMVNAIGQNIVEYDVAVEKALQVRQQVSSMYECEESLGLLFNVEKLKGGSETFNAVLSRLSLEAKEGVMAPDMTIGLKDEEVMDREIQKRRKQTPAKDNGAKAGRPVKTVEAKQPEGRFKVHRFLLASRIQYYKSFLTVKGSMQFADAKTSVSWLPSPTITKFALGAVVAYIFAPKQLAAYLCAEEPHLATYLLGCSRYDLAMKHVDQKSAQPPLGAIKKLIELARAADYLCVEEIIIWVKHVLLQLAHRLDCHGRHCTAIVAGLLQETHEVPGSEMQAIYQKCLDVVALHPVNYWKRPLTTCSDAILAEVVSLSKVTISLARIETVDFYSCILVLYYVRYLTIQNSVHGKAPMNVCERYNKHLLWPMLEYCTHRIATIFDNENILEAIASLAGANAAGDEQTFISLRSSFAATLISHITITSPALSNPPFEEAVLTYSTVRQIFTGVRLLRARMPRLPELESAERDVVNFLKREWLSMSVGGGRLGRGSAFKKWDVKEVEEVSQRIEVPVEELLGSEAGVKLERERVADKWKTKERKDAGVAKRNSNVQELKLAQAKTAAARRVKEAAYGDSRSSSSASRSRVLP